MPLLARMLRETAREAWSRSSARSIEKGRGAEMGGEVGQNPLKWGPRARRIAVAVGICGKKWGKVDPRCG